MRTIGLLFVTLVAAVPTLAWQDPRPSTTVAVPGSVKGTLDDKDERMPIDIDKGAKGGPVDSIAFRLNQPSRVYLMLECEQCLPRLVLMDGDGVALKKDTLQTSRPARVKADLKTGDYVVKVGSVVARGGSYALTVSNTAEPEATLLVFNYVKAGIVKGGKSVQTRVTVRVGWSGVTLQEADHPEKVLRTIPFADVVGIDSATTSTSNMTAAVLFGPAFAQSGHQQWITMRTSAETVTLQVEAKDYPLVLSELQRLTAKK